MWRRRPILACSALVALAACQPASSPAPAPSTAAPPGAERNAGSEAAHSFFPPGAFDARSDLDAFKARWYSTHLRAAREPALLEGREGREAYRFIWLRTFHSPVIVRVEVSRDGSGDLVAVILTGAGGYDPGAVATRSTASLSRSQVGELRLALGDVRFWSSGGEKTKEVVGVDGARWIVEGVSGGRYHVVDRWSGDPDQQRVGLVFLRLAGLEGVRPVY